MASSNAGLNLVLLGKTGAGKSASGNTILGREAFESHRSYTSLTQDVQMESGSVDGFPFDVYDTPGLLNTDMREEELMQKYDALLHECESGPCVFLLLIKAHRFTPEERETVEKIEKILGETRLEKTWILFTRGDELEEENMTIQEFIEDNEELKTLVEKYEQRYHVFNNKERGDTEQVKTLITKLKASLKKESRGLRIVLLGQAGVGKSASGNTIMGQEVFTGGSVKESSSVTSVRLKVHAYVSDGSVYESSSVTWVCSELQTTVLDRSVNEMNSVTFDFSEVQATVSGRSVSIVDTAGLFDRHTTIFDMRNKHLVTGINRKVCLSSPGAHAFLIVFSLNTRHLFWPLLFNYQAVLLKIKEMFGQEVLKYSIILFTRGDRLEDKTIEELIEENSTLRDLVHQCGGRFHVFNNRDVSNRDQVNELLQKIDSMIEQNGGGHYSHEMMEEAHGFIGLEMGKEYSKLRKKPHRMELEDEEIRLKLRRNRMELEEEEIRLKQRRCMMALEEEESRLRQRQSFMDEDTCIYRYEQRQHMMKLEEEEFRLRQKRHELEKEEHELEQRLHMIALGAEDRLKQILYVVTLTQKEREREKENRRKEETCVFS